MEDFTSVTNVITSVRDYTRILQGCLYCKISTLDDFTMLEPCSSRHHQKKNNNNNIHYWQ